MCVSIVIGKMVFVTMCNRTLPVNVTTSASIAGPCGTDTSDDSTSAPRAGPCGTDTSDDSLAPIAGPCGMDTSDDSTSAPIAGPCGMDTSDNYFSTYIWALWY